MRSMATPTDQNDMMNRMTATAMRDAGHVLGDVDEVQTTGPAACAKAGVLSATIPSPAHAIRAI